jgi:hypothetical protein
MERRLDLIRVLYERQCERSQINYWNEWARRVALRIAKGEPVTDDCCELQSVATDAINVAQLVDQLRAWGIPVTVNQQHRYSTGVTLVNEQIQDIVAKLVSDELAKQSRAKGAVVDVARLPQDPLTMTETATLHQALDAYSRHLGETGDIDANGNLVTRVGKCQDRLRYLKQAHDDMPLWKLQLPQIELIVSHWRNRPKTQRGKRCSADHARDMLKELWGFLKWLDKHQNYRWTKPRGLEDVKRTPVKLTKDTTVFQTTTVETYSPDELATIANHADEFGKALIAVCVNCAFGASEVGQWSTSKIVLNTAHPHADKVGIAADDRDSWIVGPRPKTGVYGEHLLWEEVATAIEPYLDGREVLPITRIGTQWYRTHSRNPQSKFGNWWSRLVKKAGVRPLPFGSLRDVLPNKLRQDYSEDVASIALQHGSLGEDDLLKCYANVPFKKLFDATRELRQHFEPLLKAL